MSLDIFDDVDANYVAITPPWVEWKTKKRKEEWFEKHNALVQKISQARIEQMVNNMLWYTGEFDKTQEYRVVVPGKSDQPVPRKILPRIFNHLYDITEQRVAKLSRYKPSFDVVQTNKHEENDRRVARLIKASLEAVKRRVRMDFILQEAERWNAVFGEVFLANEWNSHIGDKVSPGSIERVGDVDIHLKAPWTVFVEPRNKYEEATWSIDIWKIMHFEEARILFKDKTIESDKSRQVFTFSNDVNEKREDDVVIYRLIQLPTLYNEKGCISYFINNKLVDEEKEYPYSHGDFPWERHTDIDVPGRLFSMSFYQHLQPIQHVYNRLTSIMVRNMLLVGHPHVLLPEGSARIESFTNSPTAIRYNPIGGAKPEIITFGSVPAEMFKFRQEVGQELGQVSGVHGISRDNPPSGARANSMLKFYEEQEEQRASTQILKHNELIRRTYWKAGSIIGDYYPTSGKGQKERLIRVVGKSNQYFVESFDVAKISSEYDVIIQNSTGFSESKAGRLEEIGQITKMEQEKGVELISPEQMADVLETKNPQEAYDIATSADDTAKINNEKLLDGKEVPIPQSYWDLITHWKRLLILMNSPQWEMVGEDIKKRAKTHGTMLEHRMEEKAQNQAFKAKLEMLQGYPAFWHSSAPPPEKPQPQMAPPEPKPIPVSVQPPEPPPGMAVPPVAGPVTDLPPESIPKPGPIFPVR